MPYTVKTAIAGTDVHMIRKSLFWGLTLVLIAALISLIVRGRKLEQQQATHAVERFEEATPSPTMVLSPPDLQIEDETMPAKSKDKILHRFSIHNTGSTPYSRIQLRFRYMDNHGKIISKATRLLDRAIMPGAVIDVTDMTKEGLPASAVSFSITILSADIGAAPYPGRP